MFLVCINDYTPCLFDLYKWKTLCICFSKDYIYIYILIISCFRLFHNAFGRQPVSTKHVSYFGEYFGFREVEPGLSDAHSIPFENI